MPGFVGNRPFAGFARLFCLAWLGLGVGLALLAWSGQARAWFENSDQIATIELRELPPEARRTLGLIRQGGPFPWRKDASVFGNHEGVLPKRKRGYYHEFTVDTPEMRGRGARRIVVGGNWQTSREIYYTANHYASFSRIKE
jgi:ribonuclease T1